MKNCEYVKSFQKIMAEYLLGEKLDFFKLCEKNLKIMKKDTKSKYGFVGYVEENTGYLIVPTASKNVVKECRVESPSIVFKNFNTIYRQVIKDKKVMLSNKLEEIIKYENLPKGHIKMKNFLAVPVILKNKSVGILALADKENGFNKKDIKYLESLAKFYSLIIYNSFYIKKIEEEREKYKEIIENARDILYTIKEDGTIDFMNERYKDYGYNKEDIFGQPALKFSHPDDLKITQEALQKAIKTKKTKENLKYRVLKKDGSFFYGEQRAFITIKNKKYSRMVCSLRDITKEVELSNQILKQKEMISKIFEASHDIIYLKDNEGRYIEANISALNFLNKKKKEIIGKTDEEIFGFDIYKKIRVEEKGIFNKDIAEDVYEYSKGKKKITLDIIKSYVKNEDGEVKYILYIARDMTLMKKIEQQITLNKTINKLKGFTSKMSHDINNTFSVISGYASLLSEDKEVKKNMGQSLKVINDSIKKATKIVKKFRKASDIKKID